LGQASGYDSRYNPFHPPLFRILSNIEPEMRLLFTGVLGLLAFCSIGVWIARRRITSESSHDFLTRLNARFIAWWGMCGIFVLGLTVGYIGSVFLFTFISFVTFREFMTVNPKHKADHRVLLIPFFLVVPFQYWLVYDAWYGFFTVFIPVYAYILIPVSMVMGRDSTDFLERSARIQWGLMVCVYFISHIPMLFSLEIPGYEGENAKLMFFMVVVVQGSDIIQLVVGHFFGRHRMAPVLSPRKTWEGFIAGILAAAGLGAALWWATPFHPFQAFLIAFIVALMGFSGDLVMAAVKYSRGVQAWSHPDRGGRAGMMDRMESLCFAAPFYFHLIRFLFTDPLPKLPSWLDW
jgi:phosphatidate cytidylyltransferase